MVHPSRYSSYSNRRHDNDSAPQRRSSDREHLRYSSRPYDCCTPRTTDHDAGPSRRPRESTYGTYIDPAAAATATDDSSTCACNCCPHTSARSSRYATDDHSLRHARPAEHHHSSKPQLDRRRTTTTTTGAADRLKVPVVDLTQNGSLRRRHGQRFSLSLKGGLDAQRVLDFLAPDARRQKVVVRWRDGARETLDALIPLDEIARDARQIEIKDRKYVHWG